jgi:hypothetical protein
MAKDYKHGEKMWERCTPKALYGMKTAVSGTRLSGRGHGGETSDSCLSLATKGRVDIAGLRARNQRAMGL